MSREPLWRKTDVEACHPSERPEPEPPRPAPARDLRARDAGRRGRPRCADLAEELGLRVKALQSNHEGQLVDWIQEARGTSAGIIINPGAYSHTSVAILDALNAYDGPVLEVHISNIHKREAFRHHSFVSQRADGVIAGFGTEGYLLALRRMASLSGDGA